MATSFRFPLIELPVALAAANQHETYRHLISFALKNKCTPLDIDTSGLPSTMIRLPPAVKDQLDWIAEQHQMDSRKAFAGLCLAAARLKEQEIRQQAGLDQTYIAGLETGFVAQSQNQQRFYENMMAGLNSNRIVLAEGSTGIGKSRALAAAAIAQVKAGKSPVIIAAPTLAVMKHLYSEFMTLPGQGVSASVLPGASEFVDDTLLIPLCDDSENGVPDVVKDWVRDGAKPIDPNSVLAEVLGDAAAWLAEDLQQIAGDFPVKDFVLRGSLSETETSAARRLVQRLRSKAKEQADVIFCTHAMLALGQKSQWQVLPEPAVVLIDEAHLFEQAMANINSEQLSLYAMRCNLARYCRNNGVGSHSIAGKSLTLAKRIATSLTGLIGDEQRLCLNERDDLDGPGRGALLAQLNELDTLLASKALRNLDRLDYYRGALRLIRDGLAQPGATNNRVDLACSPDRRYPSLFAGPSRLDLQLRAIWNAAKGGVVLASATLYTLDAMGNNKCDYLRTILAIPFDRISTPLPVVDSSIYTVPRVYLPNDDHYERYIRPNHESTEQITDWHHQIARDLVKIGKTARGGTLALFTAYRDIQVIASLLRANGFSEPIIEAKPVQPFSTLEREFRAAYNAGKRPILLGLGAAWTGVDFKDQHSDCKKDFLLTDLVIVNMPIGLNRSNSMMRRMEYTGLHPIIMEALLMFKQGLGRLIRRAGVTDRRLWILDGRISAKHKWQGMEGFTAAIRKLLKNYTQITYPRNDKE